MASNVAAHRGRRGTRTPGTRGTLGCADRSNLALFTVTNGGNPMVATQVFRAELEAPCGVEPVEVIDGAVTPPCSVSRRVLPDHAVIPTKEGARTPSARGHAAHLSVPSAVLESGETAPGRRRLTERESCVRVRHDIGVVQVRGRKRWGGAGVANTLCR